MRIRKSHKVARELVVGRQCGIELGLVISHHHVVNLLVMVALDEGKIGACSGLKGHDSLDLKGKNMHKLFDLKFSKTLFEVVSV